MEVYCLPKDADGIMALAGSFGIEARVVGRIEATRRPDGANQLTIRAGNRKLEYSL